MTPEEIQTRREARGMDDPLNRLRAANERKIEAGEMPITEETSDATETVASSTFTLSIELGNDAMQSDEDVARALHRLGSWLEENSTMFEQSSGWILDSNGNDVGRWAVS